jgi:hypothetical protein
MLYARVFLAFSSVFCYFVHNLGGLTAIAAQLAKQIILTVLITSKSQTQLCVLLVLQTSLDMFNKDIAMHKVI